MSNNDIKKNEGNDTPSDSHENAINESKSAIDETCRAPAEGIPSDAEPPTQPEKELAVVVEGLVVRGNPRSVGSYTFILNGFDLSVPRGKM